MSEVTRINRIVMRGFKSFNKRTEIEFSDGFNCVLGPNGSGKCVTGDTLVHLADGSLKPIKDVVEDGLERNPATSMDDGIMAYGRDEEVLSLDTDEQEIGKRPIHAYVKREAPDELLKITTRSGRQVTATKYHPLFTCNDGKVKPAKAENLEEGMRIATPRSLSPDPSTNFTEILDHITPEDNLYVAPCCEQEVRAAKEDTWETFAHRAGVPQAAVKGLLDGQAVNAAYLISLLRTAGKDDDDIQEEIQGVKGKTGSEYVHVPWNNTKEFSRLLGYLLSDGTISGDQVRFCNEDRNIAEDCQALFETVFGKEAHLKEYKNNCYDVLLYSGPAATLLSYFGMDTSCNKRISNLYQSNTNDELIAELINGLYCGDGYVSKNSIELATKSKQFSFDLSVLLERLDMPATVREKTTDNTVYHNVVINSADLCTTWNQQITLNHAVKQERVDNLGTIANPNKDLLEVNGLVKQAAYDLDLNIAKNSERHPRLDSYCYDQCTPSRTGVQNLIVDCFLPRSHGDRHDSLESLKTAAFSDMYWDEIADIETVESEDNYVYDLCVAEDHNFIANNMVVHNSNIFDAIIFVLGKAGSKAMRAEETANLIYNGGKDKKAASSASVELYFSNEDDIFGTGNDELMIKRELGQDGSSDYIIDGEKRTRREIQELLSKAKIDPDSHNIILQGDIVRLIEMSTKERRELVEEISGIDMYEEKKDKAMRELNRVEDKLEEAEIILEERETYLEELKEERDQAMKYKELEEKIKRNKATLLDMQIQENQEELEEYEERLSDKEDELEELRDEVAEMQDTIEEKKEEAEDVNEEIEEKGETEQVELHQDVEELRVDLELKKQRRRTVEQELNKLEERREGLEDDMEEVQSKIEELEEEIDAAEDRIQEKEERIAELDKEIEEKREQSSLEDAEEVDQRIDEIEATADEIQDEVQELREEQQELLREKDRLEVQVDNVDEQIDRRRQLEEEHQEDLEQLQQDKERIKEVKHDLNEKEQRRTEVAGELDTVKGKLSTKREELSKLEAKSASIKRSIAGGKAIKAVLDKDWDGVHGTVSELGKVDQEFSLALEIAAGGRLKNIVVDTEDVAQQCIDFLKKKQLGYATFLPLNQIKPGFIKAEVRNISGSGVHGLAIDLVEFDSEYEKIFKYVLGETLIVDDIATAKDIGIGTTRMVTTEGDVVNKRGSMQGGHRSKKRTGLGFQDKEVQEDIDELEDEIADLEDVKENLAEEKRELDKEVEELQEEKSELEGNIIKLEKTLKVDSEDVDASLDKKEELEEEISEVEEAIDAVSTEIEEKTDRLTELKMERQELREELSELRNPAVLAELNSCEEERSELQDEISDLQGEKKGFESELENVLLPEKENIEEILEQQEDERGDFEEEKDELDEEIEGMESNLEELQEKQEEFQSKFKELFDRRQELSDEIDELEDEVVEKNQDIRDLEKEKNNLSVEKAEVNATLSGLEEEFEQYEGVELYEEKDEDQIREEVDEFEAMTSEMGNVNMKALDMYEQVQHEYEQLLEKKETLQEEREEVLVMINKIDSRKKELFMKTFDALQENFKRIFGNLSSKGEAMLDLENEEDPFEGGVDVKVKLGSKKFLDIRSLSGGEKTLTALSFIFAVQEYEPAPFYVLDEVDAALDKRNSEKLASLIKSYSEHAQYIIISHNDNVISDADNLYGVSMNDHGESKVTTLEV